MLDEIFTHDVVRVMSSYRGTAVARMMQKLRGAGIGCNNSSVRLLDIPPHNRRFFRSQAERAKAEIEREAKRCARDEVWAYLRSHLSYNRRNARVRKIPFELTRDQLWEAYELGGRKCQITGIPFDLNKFGCTRAPFAPSLDRIDSRRGYTAGNVRVVCQMINLAMNVWGEIAIIELMERMRLTRQNAPEFYPEFYPKPEKSSKRL